MQKLLAILLMISLWVGFTAPAQAASNTHLVPCESSAAFQERMHSAPQNYYFDEPYQLYAANLLCGEEGLPHLQLRLDRALDIVIPFGIFFYFAGFVGWSGRAYLIGGKQTKNPEETEIFINIPLALRSFMQGLLWPLLAFKELTTGELTAKESELSVSPR
ncbi:Photosystem I reaction center subunit III [Leptolyngbya cf. ectocarpi LEGE 11479]|uniref:Photosystem I reaction center subunit III n=1 Tax=Leptolyngbya cf. ectocarpi LEGE 11479 TaxID=1828722 RepID=A0A928ZUL9_LEPEC|nr:Photosystem I reaction center subunit III [Leptolyngbya ectocarpi]MBE9067772.1 Photosystem I reaction center subunit III [Leptolyngbya cf. ectocarpi LEGE 11479]